VASSSLLMVPRYEERGFLLYVELVWERENRNCAYFTSGFCVNEFHMWNVRTSFFVCLCFCPCVSQASAYLLTHLLTVWFMFSSQISTASYLLERSDVTCTGTGLVYVCLFKVIWIKERNICHALTSWKSRTSEEWCRVSQHLLSTWLHTNAYPVTTQIFRDLRTDVLQRLYDKQVMHCSCHVVVLFFLGNMSADPCSYYVHLSTGVKSQYRHAKILWVIWISVLVSCFLRTHASSHLYFCRCEYEIQNISDISHGNRAWQKLSLLTCAHDILLPLLHMGNIMHFIAITTLLYILASFVDIVVLLLCNSERVRHCIYVFHFWIAKELHIAFMCFSKHTCIL
jgi:hypothetical protein